MSEKELELFVSFLSKSSRYVEFGSGGSTVLASTTVKEAIISVESSMAWIQKVTEACQANAVRPQMVYADIGPTGVVGYPIDQRTRHRWPGYHSSLWSIPGSREGDLYLVDGRFRVACFAQVILNCPQDVIIGVHDFASRAHYHSVKMLAREIATMEDISFFQPNPGAGVVAKRLLDFHKFDPR